MTDPTTPSNAFDVLLHATGRRLTGKQHTNEHGQTVKEYRDMSNENTNAATHDGAYYDSLTEDQMRHFKCELTNLINANGLDGHTATPDYILAEAIVGYINDIQRLNKRRDEHHGFPSNTEAEGDGWEWATNE